MILNRAAVTSASTSYRALFTAALTGASPIWQMFCQEVNSNAETEVYHLPGGLAQLRQWVGDRQVQNLRRYKYQLDNEQFELTVGVPATAFEDDQLGLFNAEFEMMGAQAALHPDKLFSEALEAGFDNDGFDGVSFFSDAHPVDKGSAQSNKLTAALSDTQFHNAIKLMRKRRNRVDEPVDVMAYGGRLKLIVPPDLEATADEIVNVERLSSGASNPNYKKADVVVAPRLTNATKWYLALSGGPARPFIMQWRRKPRLVVKDGPGDDNMWNKNEVQYGVDYRGNLGYGLWQFIVGSAP